MDRFSRFSALVGMEAFGRLKSANVVVIGIGGVGCGCAEALARSGIGKMTLIDDDEVDITNINRQLVALDSTLGMKKAVAFADRVRDIAPDCEVRAIAERVTQDSIDGMLSGEIDYVADCIDDMKMKTLLAIKCRDMGIPLISSMGAGNRLDPTKLCVTDVFKTKNDPVARIMRKNLRDAGIDSLEVVSSDELPQNVRIPNEKGGMSPASAPFVPPVVGMVMASYIVRKLLDGQ